MEWIWFTTFTAGAALACSPLFVFKRSSRREPIGRMIEQFWSRGTAEELEFPELSPEEKAYLEKARLAGLTWSYRQYRTARLLTAAIVLYLTAAALLPGALSAGTAAAWGKLLFTGSAFVLMGWYVPDAVMLALARQRRMRMLQEISKFAHRMSICMSEQSDLRELILRAGRPLALMRPHLQQLAAQWGNDQREAILAFKDAIGISEGYPLVNALISLSRAKPADVSRLLAEHSRSIDASLEAELHKQIENAPVWISFYIMIPFIVCLVLFVYPWMRTVLEQLAVSFTAG